MPRRRKNDQDNALRAIRETHKLSQADASQRVGVSRTMWSSWECRTRQLTLTQLGRIQETLKLSEDEVDSIRKWWTRPVAVDQTEAST